MEEVATRTLLRCAHCAHTCCSECCRRYFEEHPGDPPSCMAPACRKRLSADNLYEAFSKAFVDTGMENARREALVRQDSAFTLPTQLHIFPLVHRYEEACAAFLASRDVAEKAERAHFALSEELYALRCARALRTAGATDAARARQERELYQRWRLTSRAVRQALLAFKQARNLVQRTHSTILYGDINGVNADERPGPRMQPEAAPRPERLFRCTADGCQGNYRADDGACMVCRVLHCVRCARPTQAGAAHECNPGDVATQRTIATTTRDCPRCHAGITRASGCSQMMCIACYCVFNWETGLEERGVIHNPHFHQLGVEERQRILDEREARGITSNREQRFLAGAGPRREVPACDPEAEMDPECEDFTSAAFNAALDAAFATAADGEALGRQLRDIYREILHHREAVSTNLRRELDGVVRNTERNARATRVEKLRGARLQVLVHIKNGHPNGFKSLAWMLPASREALPEAAHAATLMRHDTERTKLVSQLEVSDTFVEAGTGLVRLLLGATPEERPGVLAALARLHEETKRLSEELKAGKAGVKKRRAAARGGGKPKARKKAASDTEPSSAEEEEEEEADEDDDDDDDEEEDE